MTRFGIFCPPAIGHLNPMCTLAFELQRRGHTVILFGVPDALEKVATLNLEISEIGAVDYPKGSIDSTYKTLGTLTGKAGLEFTIDFFRREMRMLFREAPQAIREANIDVLIIDQVSSAMATVADYLDLPFVTVCNAMLIHREPAVPPYSTHWAYSTKPWARVRNRIGNALINSLTRDLWQKIVEQRQNWNLPPYQRRDDSYSPLAQICQLPKAFDFPRERLPAHFHYIGRFQDPSGTEPITFNGIDFPFDRLNGQPLIYASLGTLQNQRPEIFECIAQACSSLEAQLVISLGNPKAQPMDFPGNPIVVPFAPHQKLIERSTVVVTHAGMNTVLTALGCGVPLVAIPITNEQPGIAARLARTKAGKSLRLSKVNETTLRAAIAEVLTEPSYRENAQRMQKSIQASGGVERAADILEQAAQTRQPVMGTPGADI
ncbi:MAG: glycosyltransferase [Leptolyngbyaceae cyanobacterium bins.349]|nr:glycosyltransferase [Leptolyngbyaceae cyanobacterium bins.349]